MLGASCLVLTVSSPSSFPPFFLPSLPLSPPLFAPWHNRGATHSTVAAANAGLDQEMAERTFFGDKLKAAVQDGNVTMATLNDKVERQIAQMIEIGCFDNPSTG